MDASVKNRIKKLLALGASNDNEAEAKAALNKAAELAAKHGMSIEGINAETGEVSNVNKTTLTVSHKRNKAWESSLVSTIIMCFDLEAVYSSRWDGDRWFIFGTNSDLDIGLHYFKYCRMYILRSAQKKYTRKRDQVAYGMGAASALYTRLYEMFYQEKVKQESANTKALVVVKKEEVKKEKIKAFPNLRPMRTNSNVNNTNYGAYNQGKVDGKNMPLNRGAIAA